MALFGHTFVGDGEYCEKWIEADPIGDAATTGTITMRHKCGYPRASHIRAPRPIPTESDIPMHGWAPYSDVHRERIRAHAKHDERDGSMERKPYDDPIWLPVLTEEVGEVARVLCDYELGVLDGEYRAKLREELVQVAAMATAWIDAIDAHGRV